MSVKLWSINALSETTGIDRRTIKKRLVRIAPSDGNLYHGRDAFAAIYAGGNGNGESHVSPIDQSDARLRAAQAGREELKLQREREEVIEIETAYKLWEAVCSAVRQKVDALPSKVESRLGLTPKQRKTLEHETDEILNDLSKPIDYFKPIATEGDEPGD